MRKPKHFLSASKIGHRVRFILNNEKSQICCTEGFNNCNYNNSSSSNNNNSISNNNNDNDNNNNSDNDDDDVNNNNFMITIMMILLLPLLLLLLMMMMMMTTLKGMIRVLHSPQCAVDCLQHSNTSVQVARAHSCSNYVHSNRAPTTSATCNVSCATWYEGILSYQVYQSWNRIYFSLISLAESINR